MNYIVLDLEFNQAFDFRTGSHGNSVKECPFEIIQIGAVKLDKDFNITDTFSFMVKPQLYKKIHPIVERITGITSSSLKDCCDFQTAYKAFCKFVGKNAVLCTWGIDDIRSLFRNILYFKCDEKKMTDRYINIQPTAAKVLCTTSGGTIGLKSAAEQLEVVCDKKFHDALNDAYYTALIMKKICQILPEASVFDIATLAPKQKEQAKLNTKELIGFFENSLERKLSTEEIAMVLTAYKLGRTKKYDTLIKKED